MQTIRVRTFRIVEWLHGKPFRAQCTCCDRFFALYSTDVKTVEGAWDHLDSQFRHHRCEEQFAK